MRSMSAVFTSLCAAGVLLVCAQTSLAGQSFEIDTKELRGTPAVSPRTDSGTHEIDLRELRSKQPEPVKQRKRKTEKNQVAAASTPTLPEGSAHSRYTVRSGEHILLILVRHYGLSESRAEKLLPEVMRLNNIRSPRSVAAGQQLLIPLPPPKKGATVAKTKGGEAAVIAETQVSQPVVVPVPAVTTASPGVQAAPVEPEPSPQLPARQVTVLSARSCPAAHEIIEALGVMVPQGPGAVASNTFTARYGGVETVVCCAPTPAEALTLERLAGLRGARLLVLDGSESAPQVLERLASYLGLSYHVTGVGRHGTMQLRFIVSQVEPGRDIELRFEEAEKK